MCRISPKPPTLETEELTNPHHFLNKNVFRLSLFILIFSGSFLLFGVGKANATTNYYYVNGSGGTYTWDSSVTGCTSSPVGNDSSGSGTCAAPWLTLGKAWTAASASASAVIYVAAGTYSEAQNSGGPSTGFTWTFHFSQTGNTIVQQSGNTSSNLYIFRATAGQGGTTIFQGGQGGATKNTKFTFPSGYTQTNAGWWYEYNSSSSAGATFDIRDIEIDASPLISSGGTANLEDGAGATGSNPLPTFYFRRCFIHDFPATGNGYNALSGNTYFLADFFVNDSVTYQLQQTPNVYVYNNTFYYPNNNFAGAANTATGGIFYISGVNTEIVRIKNNLIVTNKVDPTNSPDSFISLNLGSSFSTFNNFSYSNNIAWKTIALSTPRALNDYIDILDDNEGPANPANQAVQIHYINNLITLDPKWTGSTTVPSVAATSLTIGRGANVSADADVSLDFTSNPYGTGVYSIGAYAGGTTEQYVTRDNKTLLCAGDSWTYEDMSQGITKPCSQLTTDSDFSGWTFVKMPEPNGSTVNTFPGLPGALFTNYFGMITELTASTTGGSPSVIVYSGGGNDMDNNGECYGAGEPDAFCLAGTHNGTGLGADAADIAQMHEQMADILNSLYAPGNKPLIVSLAAQPRDAVGDIDGTPEGPVYMSVATTTESLIAPYFDSKGYRVISYTTHGLKVGMSTLYTAGQTDCDNPISTGNGVCAHPNQTGWNLGYELLKAAILSQNYIASSSETISFATLNDTSDPAFGYKYGLTIAGDSDTVSNYTVNGFAKDGILIKGDSPTIENTISYGNGTSSGHNVTQALTGATLGALTENYNDFGGSLLINGSTPSNGIDSITTNPGFISSSNLSLSSTSPAIDAGTLVSGLTTDILGNPIYGPGTIGAYAYQPPYTAGASVPSTGTVRFYSNGNYRMAVATSSSNTVGLSVTPVGGFYTASTSIYTDLSVNNWTTLDKNWTASSTVSGIGYTLATSTVYALTGLTPSTQYTFKRDGSPNTNITGNGSTVCTGSTCTSDSSGNLSFTYSGGYSSHIFDLSQSGPTISSVVSPTTPAANKTPQFSFSSSEAGILLTSGTCAPYTPSNTTVAAAPASNTFTFTTMPDGTYSNCAFSVIDAGGNDSATTTLDSSGGFLIDTTGPSGSLTNASGSIISTPTPTLNPLITPTPPVGTTGAQMKFSCANTGPWSAWTAYSTTPITSFNVDTGPGCTNSDGTKTVYVEYEDSLGNITAAPLPNTGAFTLDTVTPVASLSGYPGTSGIYTASTTATVTVSGSDIDGISINNYEYKLDAGSYSAPTSTTTPITLTNLTPGSHTLSVIGETSLGWQSTPTTYTWTIEITGPVLSSTFTPANNATTTNTGTFSWGAATDPAGIASYSFYLDNTLLASNLSTPSYTPGTTVLTCPATHTWYISASNTLGTVTSSTPLTVNVTCAPAPATIETTPVSNGAILAGIIGSTPNPLPGMTASAPSSSSGLSSTQVSSILNLLSSFGADTATINQVQAALGQTTTTTTSSPSTTYSFIRNLKLGMEGADVKALQEFLNNNGFTVAASGPGSKGNETTKFGAKTYQALVNYQKSVGLPGTGYFGVLTRGHVNAETE